MNNITYQVILRNIKKKKNAREKLKEQCKNI